MGQEDKMKNKAKTIGGYRYELRRRAFGVLAGTIDAMKSCSDLDDDDGLTPWIMFEETLTAYEHIGLLSSRDCDRWIKKFDDARGNEGMN